MLPTGFKTTLLRVHAKTWTAVYRFCRDREWLRWFSDFANTRRCWYLRAWYANAHPSYERFCSAVRALDAYGREDGCDGAEKPVAPKDGVERTQTRRPLTPQEREWLRRFPKFDENGDPFAQMTKVAKYMDEGFMLFDRK